MTSGQKGAATRKAKSQARIWAEVERAISANRCRCDLRPGMTAEELQPLGAGCTDPQYCCPALDKYRREVPRIPMEEF